MTEKLKQIRNFISEKISQDEFKIVDYDNSFKIHIFLTSFMNISISPDCIQVKFWAKITMN